MRENRKFHFRFVKFKVSLEYTSGAVKEENGLLNLGLRRGIETEDRDVAVICLLAHGLNRSIRCILMDSNQVKDRSVLSFDCINRR